MREMMLSGKETLCRSMTHGVEYSAFCAMMFCFLDGLIVIIFANAGWATFAVDWRFKVLCCFVLGVALGMLHLRMNHLECAISYTPGLCKEFETGLSFTGYSVSAASVFFATWELLQFEESNPMYLGAALLIFVAIVTFIEKHSEAR